MEGESGRVEGCGCEWKKMCKVYVGALSRLVTAQVTRRSTNDHFHFVPVETRLNFDPKAQLCLDS